MAQEDNTSRTLHHHFHNPTFCIAVTERSHVNRKWLRGIIILAFFFNTAFDSQKNIPLTLIRTYSIRRATTSPVRQTASSIGGLKKTSFTRSGFDRANHNTCFDISSRRSVSDDNAFIESIVRQWVSLYVTRDGELQSRPASITQHNGLIESNSFHFIKANSFYHI